MLIELEPIGEIRWYAYQKLTNDMNISSHVHRLYMFFFKVSQNYIPICAYCYQKSCMVQSFSKICDVLSASQLWTCISLALQVPCKWTVRLFYLGYKLWSVDHRCIFQSQFFKTWHTVKINAISWTCIDQSYPDTRNELSASGNKLQNKGTVSSMPYGEWWCRPPKKS